MRNKEHIDKRKSNNGAEEKGIANEKKNGSHKIKEAFLNYEIQNPPRISKRGKKLMKRDGYILRSTKQGDWLGICKRNGKIYPYFPSKNDKLNLSTGIMFDENNNDYIKSTSINKYEDIINGLRNDDATDFQIERIEQVAAKFGGGNIILALVQIKKEFKNQDPLDFEVRLFDLEEIIDQEKVSVHTAITAVELQDLDEHTLRKLRDTKSVGRYAHILKQGLNSGKYMRLDGKIDELTKAAEIAIGLKSNGVYKNGMHTFGESKPTYNAFAEAFKNVERRQEA